MPCASLGGMGGLGERGLSRHGFEFLLFAIQRLNRE